MCPPLSLTAAAGPCASAKDLLRRLILGRLDRRVRRRPARALPFPRRLDDELAEEPPLFPVELRSQHVRVVAADFIVRELKAIAADRGIPAGGLLLARQQRRH